MTRFLCFALALLALPACMPSSGRGAQCGRPSRARSDVANTVDGILLVAGIAAVIIDASQEPPPPEPPMSGPVVAPLYPFDRDAAGAALKQVKYLDCGIGGVVDLSVTFRPNGTVREVLVDDGRLDDETEACVVARFDKVRVERFTGVPRTMRIRIRLHDPVAM
jgi:hypothetical protein